MPGQNAGRGLKIVFEHWGSGVVRWIQSGTTRTIPKDAIRLPVGAGGEIPS